MPDLLPELFAFDRSSLIFFVIAFIGGIISVPIGGSFMFIIPAFLFLGLDGAATILLARTFMVGAMASSSGYFFFKTKFDWREVLPFLGGNLIGYILAAQVAASIDIELLTKIVPWILVIGGIVLLKKYSIKNPRYRDAIRFSLPLIGLVLGFYGGLGGGGNGQIIALVFAFAFAWSMNRALVNTRLVELLGNILAVTMYLLAGFALTGHELPVLAAGAIGGLIGAHITLKTKPTWLKYGFLALALAGAIKVTFF